MEKVWLAVVLLGIITVVILYYQQMILQELRMQKTNTQNESPTPQVVLPKPEPPVKSVASLFNVQTLSSVADIFKYKSEASNLADVEKRILDLDKNSPPDPQTSELDI